MNKTKVNGEIEVILNVNLPRGKGRVCGAVSKQIVLNSFLGSWRLLRGHNGNFL